MTITRTLQILYAVFAFRLTMRILDKSVSHYGSQILQPWLNMVSYSKVLQVAHGFYWHCTCPTNSILLCPPFFSVLMNDQFLRCWLLSQFAATYTFTKYLLQHGWPIWNISFQYIYSHIDEYEMDQNQVIIYTFVNK